MKSFLRISLKLVLAIHSGFSMAQSGIAANSPQSQALIEQATTGLSSQEIEKYNAAAGFAFAMAATLGSIRTECQQILPDPTTGVNTVALQWWARNKEDLDSAFVCKR